MKMSIGVKCPYLVEDIGLSQIIMYEYFAKGKRVIDGDTVVLIISVGFHTYHIEKVRLLSVDTPERGKKGFEEAKEYTHDFIFDIDNLNPNGKEEWNLIIETKKTDSFGRYLATIYNTKGECLNTLLIEEGLAKPYK